MFKQILFIRKRSPVCLHVLLQDAWSHFLLKGTNGRQKTYEIFHVYCIFYSGFMCQTTVIFEIKKDGSLVLNTLAHEIVSLAETSFKMALTICQNV